jgi:hypothetical protein
MFMSPANIMTLFGSVTGGAATGYDDDHLVDGRPGRPAKAADGSPAGATWVITGPESKAVSHVIVANHDIPEGSAIAVTGGVTASLQGPPAQANGIALNAWAAVATAAVTNTITVDIDVAEVIVGEVLAGLMTELTPGILLGTRITYMEGSELPNGAASALPGYDDAWEQRSIEVQILCEEDSDVEALEQWWKATRGDTRPSVLIPFPDKNDAWVGHLHNFTRLIDQDGQHRVTFTFVEYPRTRW